MSPRERINPTSIVRTLLVLALALGVAGAAAALHLPGWTKHPDNPVLGTVPGEWDAAFINLPSIVFDGSTYHMWYEGWSWSDDHWVSGVGYATSPDGRVWTKHPDNPVLTLGEPGEWDSTGLIGAASVVYDGAGTFTMWYAWLSGFPVQDGTAIGMATSTDGVSWTKYAGNPVLTSGPPGSWDDALVAPSVVFDGESYHMWYTGRMAGTTIGYASSPDGIAWTKHPGPVFEGAVGDGVWDTNLRGGAVFQHGDTFHMLYNADTPTTEGAIGYASSPDGLVWTRGAEGPVLAPSPRGIAFDSCNVGFNGVLAVGGQAMLYYWAWGCPDHEPALGLATVTMDEIAVEFPRADRLNDNRFQVSALWWDSDGNIGDGVPVRLANDTGSFWFFDEANLEVTIKVLNGCAINDRFWVFASGMTNVGVTLTVWDTVTGETMYYNNTLGEPFQPIQDTAAFDVCD